MFKYIKSYTFSTQKMGEGMVNLAGKNYFCNRNQARVTAESRV